jgi:predicted nucleic acid-binding protein
MSALLLDASVVLAASDYDDDNRAAALALLADESLTLTTIDLARYEVANTAARGWSKPEKVAPLLRVLDRIEDDGGIVDSSQTLIAHAAELAERHAISVYDAAYVAAATAGGHRLVSCDVRDLVSKGLAELPGDSAA